MNKAKLAVKQSYKIAKFTAETTRKATVAAAKVTAKVAVYSAKIAAQAAIAIVSNPHLLAAVAIVILLVVIVSSIGGSVSSMAGSVSGGTVGRLAGDDVDTDTEMQERYNKYAEKADEKWRDYANDVIDDYSDYDEVSSNDYFFYTVDKAELFAILYTKKLKGNPDLDENSLKFSDREIADFLRQYTKVEVETGSYEVSHSSTSYDADGNAHTSTWTETITTADITFSLNEYVMDDLGFTDEEKEQVKAIKEMLSEMF